MFNRRKLARERLEVILLQLILIYRMLLLVFGVFFLLAAIVLLLPVPALGVGLVALAVIFLMICSSFRAAQVTARVGAWIGTLGYPEE